MSLRGVLNSAALRPVPVLDKAAKSNRPSSAIRQPKIVRPSLAHHSPGTPHDLPVRFDPLYLLYCSALWHKHGNPTAGWELVAALRSLDTSSHRIATSFLATTQDSRFLSRELHRGVRHTARRGITILGRPQSYDEVDMRYARSLQLPDNCQSCKLRKTNWFCGFSSDLLRSFSAATRPASYPGGALLFIEGQRPRGAFIVCSGRVKLSTTSREGKVLILKVAGPGEVLGLSAVISGSPYETTAETVGDCRINFVERESMVRMVEGNAEMSLRSIRALSTEFQSVYRDIHELVLARSSAGKLARLLLSWTRPEGEKTERESRVPSSLTHEEMAQMIGASRETVTRLLGDLKKKELIRLDGSTLVIRDRLALEQMAA